MATTETLRRRFFSLAGRITLHLPQGWPWQNQFSSALARLRTLPLASDAALGVRPVHHDAPRLAQQRPAWAPDDLGLMVCAENRAQCRYQGQSTPPRRGSHAQHRPLHRHQTLAGLIPHPRLTAAAVSLGGFGLNGCLNFASFPASGTSEIEPIA